ncbi:hypothetical protein [Neobacillus massiliamazoniensis]|uniref:Uncharacterized protein n=1 Tax=Neobacillus massiliamazoniensis TaxID=1499688 RepID=A0A0U1NZS2_9BACI|nr:hypothetical protein [Neobacillus massiliamazoniensis]CRK83342.1 hypothetical protein BN000_03306 [Neobacillus massiliamazoniensis]
MSAEQILVDFVEGKMTIEEFKTIFINNPSIEEFLKDDPNLKKDTYIGDNTYDFILQEGQDRNGIKNGWQRIGGQLNIHGAICQHLTRKVITFTPSNIYSEKYNLILDTQPSWLDIDEDFFYEEILSKAPQLKKSELKKWLKNRIKEMFKYASTPPRWLQNPEWLIINKKPLTFLCQQNINNFFHDKATVYVFIDDENGELKTVLQVF